MPILRRAAALVLLPTAAVAQEIPPVVPTLPAPSPNATPAATPTPEPTPSPTPPPSPTASPTPRPTLAPAPTPTPSLSPTPSVQPAAAAPPPAAPTPTPIVTPTIPPAPARDNEAIGWTLVALLGGLAAVVLGLLLLLRRRRMEPVAAEPDRAEPEPVVPVRRAPRFLDRTPPTAVTQPTVGYRAVSIGLNLLSLTAEGEVTVTNPGDAAIEGVEVRVAVLGIAREHAAAIAAVHRTPPRPALPAFTLQPGEARTVRAIAAVAREAIEPLSAGGRPLVVPLVVVALAWRGGRVTQAFAVGVDRVDSPKLAPIWLDGDQRRYLDVAARPHGGVIA